MFDGIVSENIVSNLTDKRDISTDSLGGDCLIGALTSGAHGEDSAKDCLAGSRQRRGLDCHVSVAAA